MAEQPFDTPLVLSGPFGSPKQMLASQEYFGSTSIHDDATAEKLGFAAGGPIEGPTHFSQFVPLLAHLWGEQWFETGTLSGANSAGIRFNSADGTYNFNGPTTLNGGNFDTIFITDGDGTINFGPGTTITSPAGAALNIIGGTTSVTYSGSISQTNLNRS